jgi:glyoxylase I family protein
MPDHDLDAELLRLERALAERDPSGVDGGLMSLVATDFVEIGRSGRTWTRESIREVLEGPLAAVPLEAFEVAMLADDIALATYRTPGAKRSSIWVRRDGRWQIRFHQGTPVTP